MSVTAYPIARKRKSYDICQAFATGCSGGISIGRSLSPGPAFFWGVDESNMHLWKEARARGDYFYGDNSYFDGTRGTYFRVTHNALQHSGVGKSSCERFAKTGETIAPWNQQSYPSRHIVLCEQSEFFMREIVGVSFDWVETTKEALAKFTWRKFVLRSWSPDKAKLSRSLGADLENASALVTWSSAAAVTAILSGVRAVSCGQSAASIMGGDLADIESLPTPEREQWAGVLADNQWTLDEMRSGRCWNDLCRAQQISKL